MATKKANVIELEDDEFKGLEDNSDEFFGSSTDEVDADGSEILDLSGVDDTITIQVWAPGDYDGNIEDVTYGLSKRSGNPMYTWVLRLRNEDGKSRKFYMHTVLDETGLPRIKRYISRVAPDVGFQFKKNELGQHLAGRPCRGKLGTEVYQGQRRNKVTDILAAAVQADSFLP